MTQTAVEWLNRQISLNSKIKENSKGEIFFTIGLSKIDELFKQAKEIEKEQIVEAYKQGIAYWNGDEWKLINIEQYYNETFKNTNK
jgi:hypothetical protein